MAKVGARPQKKLKTLFFVYRYHVPNLSHMDFYNVIRN